MTVGSGTGLRGGRGSSGAAGALAVSLTGGDEVRSMTGSST